MHLPRIVRRRVVRTVVWSSVIVGQTGLISLWSVGALNSASARAAQPHIRSLSGMGAPSAMERAMASASKSAPLTVMLHRKVVRVTIDNFAFRPARLEVSPGTTIIWTNKDSDPHTVSSSKSAWSSEALDTDSTYSRAFKKEGAYSYFCKIHPFMQATVLVKG